MTSRFKRDEIAFELRHEDAEMGVYNKYNSNTYARSYSKAYYTESYDANEYKTFDEWKDLSKWVKKGSKSTRKNGKALFHITQVR